MVRKGFCATRISSVRLMKALSLCISMTLFGVTHSGPELAAQEREVRDEQCEQALRQPLTTLDLNGDGVCNEIDITLFKTLADSCERDRLSQERRLEKLDLDCDGCVTRRDVETFRAYCDKVAGKSKLSTSPTTK